MLFSRSLGFLANANPFTFVKDANTYYIYIPREATIEKQWAAFSTTFFLTGIFKKHNLRNIFSDFEYFSSFARKKAGTGSLGSRFFRTMVLASI